MRFGIGVHFHRYCRLANEKWLVAESLKHDFPNGYESKPSEVEQIKGGGSKSSICMLIHQPAPISTLNADSPLNSDKGWEKTCEKQKMAMNLCQCDFLSIHHFQCICQVKSGPRSDYKHRITGVIKNNQKSQNDVCVEPISTKQPLMEWHKGGSHNQPPYCHIHMQDIVNASWGSSCGCVERRAKIGVWSPAKAFSVLHRNSYNKAMVRQRSKVEWLFVLVSAWSLMRTR